MFHYLCFCCRRPAPACSCVLPWVQIGRTPLPRCRVQGAFQVHSSCPAIRQGAFRVQVGYVSVFGSGLPAPNISKPMSSDSKQKRQTGASAAGQEKVVAAEKKKLDVSFSVRIEEKPRTKFGELRHLWPEIKTALRDGNKLKQVWECVVEGGIDLSWPKFRTYVARLRNMESSGADFPVRQASRQNQAQATEYSQPTLGKRDPLLNLKTHLNKRPGFEFDERPPDKNKLI